MHSWLIDNSYIWYAWVVKGVCENRVTIQVICSEWLIIKKNTSWANIGVLSWIKCVFRYSISTLYCDHGEASLSSITSLDNVLFSSTQWIEWKDHLQQKIQRTKSTDSNRIRGIHTKSVVRRYQICVDVIYTSYLIQKKGLSIWGNVES